MKHKQAHLFFLFHFIYIIDLQKLLNGDFNVIVKQHRNLDNIRTNSFGSNLNND